MILEVCGIFILAFALGYWAAGVYAAIKKRKTASERRNKPLSVTPREKNRPEKLN